MFSHLKKWEILHGGSVDSIKTKEKELDVAMALHNLNLRARLDLLRAIPTRAKYPPGCQIITSDLEPKISIPKFLKPTDAKFPSHLTAFIAALSSIGPTLHKIVIAARQFDIFSDRTKKRGENLFLGGCVLQISVEKEDLDVWRVRFLVGASRKHCIYRCYARLNQDSGILSSICECMAG